MMRRETVQAWMSLSLVASFFDGGSV